MTDDRKNKEKDKRTSVRTPMVCRIKISHESVGDLEVSTRDMSDGGVFVVLDSQPMPPVGSVVTGQIKGLAGEGPVVPMEVVRVEQDGVGLKYIDP